MRRLGVGLIAALMAAGPAAADIGEPVKVAVAESSAKVSYRYFEGRGSAQTPGAYWNPCRTVTYGIDFRAATKRGLSSVWEQQRWQSAIDEFAKASGLRFRYVGQIRTHAAGRKPAAVPGVDIAIAFVDQARYRSALKGSVAGVGGVTWRTTAMAGHKRIVSGYVIIDAADVVRQTSSWRQAFDARPATQRTPDTLRALYMHEFGHAIGLEHVHDRRQLMYPAISASRPDAFGPGDLVGLRKLGRQTCF